MPRPIRSRQINLEKEIISAAWRQIAEKGAPALSLRGIARSLKITAPAIYNYFPNKDALVTALIVDAFSSFGDAQVKALSEIPDHAHAHRLMALGFAYRQWAITFPERYQLIFGTPIAGYNAPRAVTMPAAERALRSLLNTLAAAEQEGVLQIEGSIQINLEEGPMISDAHSPPLPGVKPGILYSAISIWSRVHGLVSLEIGNQYPPYISNPAEIFTREIENLTIEYIQAGNKIK
jgi:AcrR family transcriptional regulator